jgi:hypothetical protein
MTYKYNISTNTIVFSCILLFSTNNYSMQSEVKAKRAFDEVSFYQKLNLLPKDIQTHAVGNFFWQRSPKIINQNGTESDPQTLAIDYRLIPAILSFDCVEQLRNMIWSINFSRRGGYYHRPGCDLDISRVTNYRTITSKNNINFFHETKFIRDNPHLFIIFGSQDNIKAYVHASHAKKLEQLTLEQLNFISDLFKAQTNLNKGTKLIPENADRRIKLTLNEAQTDLFYSFPIEVRENLKKHYSLIMPTERQAPANPPPQVPQKSVSDWYAKYKHKPLVRLAKIVLIAGLIYYGLHRATGWQRICDKKIVLFIAKALKHKKKFLIGTAALIVAIEIYGPIASRYIAKRWWKFLHLR